MLEIDTKTMKLYVTNSVCVCCCRLCGPRPQYDIVVATPGRLVDHINKTQGFDLSQLRYLVCCLSNCYSLFSNEIIDL